MLLPLLLTLGNSQSSGFLQPLLVIILHTMMPTIELQMLRWLENWRRCPYIEINQVTTMKGTYETVVFTFNPVFLAFQEYCNKNQFESDKMSVEDISIDNAAGKTKSSHGTLYTSVNDTKFPLSWMNKTIVVTRGAKNHTKDSTSVSFRLEHHSIDFLKSFVESIYADHLKEAYDQQCIYTWGLNERMLHCAWTRRRCDNQRPFSSIYLNEANKTVQDDLLNFLQNEQEYARMHTKWKRGYLFHGPPGTGKTSLIKAFAHTTKWPLYFIDLHKPDNNTQLWNMMTSIPSKSILVFEEVDVQGICNREAIPDYHLLLPRLKVDETEIKATPMEKISTMLTVLDGLHSSNGHIIIMTTNHLDRIDSAILRAGRIDVKYHLDYADQKQMEDMYRKSYMSELNESPTDRIILDPTHQISPSTISGIFIKNIHDPVKARTELKELVLLKTNRV